MQVATTIKQLVIVCTLIAISGYVVNIMYMNGDNSPDSHSINDGAETSEAPKVDHTSITNQEAQSTTQINHDQNQATINTEKVEQDTALLKPFDLSDEVSQNLQNLPQPTETSSTVVDNENSMTGGGVVDNTAAASTSEKRENQQTEEDESKIEDENKRYSAYEINNKANIDWSGVKQLQQSRIVKRVVKQGQAKAPTKDSPTEADYAFPTIKKSDDSLGVTENPDNPSLHQPEDQTVNTDLSIPDDNLPSRNSRRLILEGDGPLLGSGSTVLLHYDMFSWSTGALIQSTKTLGQPLSYTIDGPQNTITFPAYLKQSIVNRTAGSRIMVVFKKGLEDLPAYLDSNDAYVLIVDVNY